MAKALTTKHCVGQMSSTKWHAITASTIYCSDDMSVDLLIALTTKHCVGQMSSTKWQDITASTIYCGDDMSVDQMTWP